MRKTAEGLLLVDALSKQWSYFFPSCGGKVVYCFIEIPYAAAMTTKPPARAGLDTARAGPEMTSNKLHKAGQPRPHWNEPGLPERKRGVSRNRWYPGTPRFWRSGAYRTLTSADGR